MVSKLKICLSGASNLRCIAVLGMGGDSGGGGLAVKEAWQLTDLTDYYKHVKKTRAGKYWSLIQENLRFLWRIQPGPL